ncbi:lipid droplet-associated hydrolase [Senna tora]|uniref:Lipid droplet-associated hydrolase n=1 Tax=Senna tora TaxID=362788 RepID=A0A834SHM2_9FABA|nr:lipid droplet-associated hydrolase [Senna tora]
MPPIPTYLVASTARIVSLLFPTSRINFSAKWANNKNMVTESLLSKAKKRANFRLRNVSSFTTELLEIHSDDPSFHVLFVPGNPGVVTFYKDFIEFLYEQLGGSASITGKIGSMGDYSHYKNKSIIRLFYAYIALHSLSAGMAA